MRRAVTATSAAEREKWLRVALAWRDLAKLVGKMQHDEVPRETALCRSRAAARKLIERAKSSETVQDGRTHIEKIARPSYRRTAASPLAQSSVRASEV